jgi:ATPase subunit of ABC transporter with duplicated ATPase domains
MNFTRFATEVPKNSRRRAATEVPKNSRRRAATEVPKNSRRRAATEVPKNSRRRAATEVPNLETPRPSGRRQPPHPRVTTESGLDNILKTVTVTQSAMKSLGPPNFCVKKLKTKRGSLSAAKQSHIITAGDTAPGPGSLLPLPTPPQKCKKTPTARGAGRRQTLRGSLHRISHSCCMSGCA